MWSWPEGWCTNCGNRILERPDDVGYGDYFKWCPTPTCENHSGISVGDQDQAPPWEFGFYNSATQRYELDSPVDGDMESSAKRAQPVTVQHGTTVPFSTEEEVQENMHEFEKSKSKPTFDTKKLLLEPKSFPIQIDQCPPGPFVFGEYLYFKTSSGKIYQENGQALPGEFADLLVSPVRAEWVETKKDDCPDMCPRKDEPIREIEVFKPASVGQVCSTCNSPAYACMCHRMDDPVSKYSDGSCQICGSPAKRAATGGYYPFCINEECRYRWYREIQDDKK
jgi:hypothetical protein